MGLKVKPKQLSKDLMRSFTDYLIKRFTREGAHTLYARFKKMILAAVEKDIIRKNPCTGVSIKKDYGQLKKDILSQEEIMKLVATHYDKENPDIRRAFIFVYTPVCAGAMLKTSLMPMLIIQTSC